MSVTAYLMVNRAGSVRVNKNGLDVRKDEIAIELRLTIPETFFNRPRPVVDITIPDGLIQSLTPESAVRITASAVAGALGATVEQVMDGLGEVIEQREHRRFEARKASIAPGWIQPRDERQEVIEQRERRRSEAKQDESPVDTQANQTGHGEAKQVDETTGSNAGEASESNALVARMRQTGRVEMHAGSSLVGTRKLTILATGYPGATMVVGNSLWEDPFGLTRKQRYQLAAVLLWDKPDSSDTRVSVERSALSEVYELAVETASPEGDGWPEEDIRFVDRCLEVVKAALSQGSIPAAGEPEKGDTS